MKSILKLLLILILIQIVFIKPLLALDIRYRDNYLSDARGDDGDIYLNHISLYKNLDSIDTELGFFTEVQWNMDISEWEKLMFGLEATKTFKKYFYLGQTIQFISGQFLDHMAFKVDNTSIDATTKIGFKVPIWKSFSFRFFEEYTLNLEKGRDECSEVGTEIEYKSKGAWSIGIGWHHTDRIHNFDTDYVNSSFTLEF